MSLTVQSLCLAVILLFPTQLIAETQLYRGTLDAVTGSGKLCKDVLGKHAVSLIIEDEGKTNEMSGYFEGENLTIGKFSGADLSGMAVNYPFYDDERAKGHLISLFRANTQLTGELRDKHVDDNADECSFDLAHLNLQLVAKGEPARDQKLQMSKLFDAQLANSRALALAGKADYEKALPLFEQVIELVETAKERERFPLNSAIVGLAGCYFRLGRFQDFNLFYDKHFGSVTAEWVKYILNNQRQTAQLHLGRAAAGRGEYDDALNILIPAYKLDMHNMEIIGAIVRAYIRSNRLSEAGSFLEQAEPRLAREADRKEIAGAIAMVSFLKARKEEKEGKPAEAEAHLRTSVSRNPEFAAFWVALARQRHKAGSYEEARKLLQEGLEQVKDDPSRNEIVAALEKMQQIESIMKSVR